MPVGEPALYVGHCTWAASDEGEDVIGIYRVADIDGIGPVKLNKPVSVVSGRINQESLDTLYFQYNEKFIMDELRVGPTYESVLLGTVATSPMVHSKVKAVPEQ